jgi:hypothetical protein
MPVPDDRVSLRLALTVCVVVLERSRVQAGVVPAKEMAPWPVLSMIVSLLEPALSAKL